MLQDERQALIVKHLKENQSVRIGDLARILGVTRETVRRDLYELERQGIVKKVHGGAILMKTNEEPPYSKRAVSNVIEKELIARRASEFVEDGDALFIDSGTTALLFAKYLGGKAITVVTTALLAALELSRFPNVKVIMSGGELRPEELTLSGPAARKSLESFYVDKAFIGVGGISPDSGYTDYHVGECDIRILMMNNAKETFVLADSSKFHVTAFTKVADLHDVDYVITDAGIPDAMKKKLEENGVQVVVA